MSWQEHFNHEDRVVGRRRAKRQQLSAAGFYRTGSGTPRNVILTDISKTGCRFVDVTNRLYVGTQLTLKIGAVGPIDAVVAWIDNRVVGVRFNAPLYESFLDHLVASGSPRDGLNRRVNAR